MTWTPVQEILKKIVSDFENGTYPDRDQKRFAFYDRLNLEAEAFEESMVDENPFHILDRYSDEPVMYDDDETQERWEQWLAAKGLDVRGEFQ